MTNIQEKLFALQDKEYKSFTEKLNPNVDPKTIIGVKVPIIRKLAEDNFENHDFKKFLNVLPHEYYDENMLHGMLVSQISDYDECISKIDRFLPYIDNWSVCDSLKCNALKKNKEDLIEKIYVWLYSNREYTIRFALNCLMSLYLDEGFKKEYLRLPLIVMDDDRYYVKMMIAWFYATALAKRYRETIDILEDKELPVFIHNKTIEKALESFRVTVPHKEYLRTLKIKEK